MWQCDTVAETCTRTEPGDFFWQFIVASSIMLTVSAAIVILLSFKREHSE